MFTLLKEVTVWDKAPTTPNLTYVVNKLGALVAYKNKDGWQKLDVALKQFNTTRRKFKKKKFNTLEEAMV